jgi:Domain of unknown function (DUF384)
MAEVDSSVFYDLAPLFMSPSIRVRTEAANIAQSLTENHEFIKFLSSPAGLSLLRQILRAFESSESDQLLLITLSTLINITGHSEIVNTIIKDLSGATRIVNSLNSRQVYIQMHCSLLANLTREKDALEEILKVPNLFRALLLKYSADPDEHLDSLGLVIQNASGNDAVREELCLNNGLLLQCLVRGIAIRRRRLLILRILRNLAIDQDTHPVLIDVRVPAKIGIFLYPISENRRIEDAPEEVKENNNLGLATDIETRYSSVELLFGLTRTKIGRDGLRDQKIYEYLRLWEEVESDAAIKEKLHTVIHIIILTEEEIEKGNVEY